MEIPESCDIAAFLLSDGKLNGAPKPMRTISLGKLAETYLSSLPNDALEQNNSSPGLEVNTDSVPYLRGTDLDTRFYNEELPWLK